MADWKNRCLLASFTLAIVAFSELFYVYKEGWSHLSYVGLIGAPITVICCVVLSAIALDIWSMGPADSLSFQTLIVNYRKIRTIFRVGKQLNDEFEAAIWDFTNVQERKLMDILKTGSQTKLGQDLGLGEISSVGEFRKALPLSTYENYREYVELILAGENDVMFPGFPVYFATTSGSTGKHKLYPKSGPFIEEFNHFFGLHPTYVILTNIPRRLRLRKIIRIGCYTNPTKLECGINKGPISVVLASSSSLYTTPKEAIYLTDNDASLYINLLFSLREKDISMISTLFSSSTLAFFQRMQTSWQSLCDDIESGTIQPHPHISDNVHQNLQTQFTSHPQRAAFLRQEFQKGFVGIAKRIWPDIGMVSMISSGPFLAAMEVLGATYTKGLRNFSRAYGGTEAFCALNRSCFVNNPPYTLLGSRNFFELLPIGAEDTILPQEAEIGEMYEIVITTPEGLYRYKSTDVVKAAGFHGNALYFNFVQRAGEVLNVRNEKTPVSVVEACLRSTLHALVPQATIVDYCCTENLYVDKVTGGLTETRYWVFLELTPQLTLPDGFAKMMDESLMTSLASYRNHRDHATASQVKVVCVKAATFTKLRDKVLADRVLTAFDQYKCPRLTRMDHYVKHLLDNVA